MRDWGGYVGMSLLGYFLGVSNLGIDYMHFAVFLVTVALYLGFSFSVNNCFDHEGDRLGEKASKNPIATNQMSVRSGIIFSALLALSGLALSGVWFGVGPMIIYSVLIILSGAYSTPPLRFKSLPVIDMLSHGLFFGSLIVFFGVSVSGGSNPLTMFLLADVFILSLTLELYNQIDDVAEDTESGVKTTVVLIGTSSAKKLLQVFLLTHITMLFYVTAQLHNPIITGMSMAFFIGVAYVLLRRRNKDQFLFLVEKITPLVYLIYLLTTML
jgi:4-hydroxybenzoate polyprenyltransferase